MSKTNDCSPPFPFFRDVFTCERGGNRCLPLRKKREIEPIGQRKIISRIELDGCSLFDGQIRYIILV